MLMERPQFQCPQPVAPQVDCRILSLTGGGLLGVISVAFLERFEILGRQRYGAAYRLCDSFDLVGGTSTGGVIATAVALGLDASTMADFYLVDAPKVFRRRTFAVPGLSHLFCHEALRWHYAAVSGGRHLHRSDLECDLSVVVKSLDPARPVLLTTLDSCTDTVLGADIRAEPVPLDDLLCATTAAPGLFRAASLPIGPDKAPVLCVDGGISPFNDPSELLWHHAATTFADRSFDITAIGTGITAPRYREDRFSRRSALYQAITALTTMVPDGVRRTEATMRQNASMPGRKLAWRKHDIPLTEDTFRLLGLSVSRRELKIMRNFADPGGTARVYEAAALYAERTLTQALPLRRHAAHALPAA